VIDRAINRVVSALFALDKIYPRGDKRAIEIIEKQEVNGRISNLLPITLSFGEGWVRQKKCVNLKCAQYTPV
jgi:hypothetical protein